MAAIYKKAAVESALEAKGFRRRESHHSYFVEKVAVGEMLQGEAVRTLPVVEDLAAEQVFADPPAVFVTRLLQGVVPGIMWRVSARRIP